MLKIFCLSFEADLLVGPKTQSAQVHSSGLCNQLGLCHKLAFCWLAA